MEHENVCPNVVISCSAADVGCTTVDKRKLVQEHERCCIKLLLGPQFREQKQKLTELTKEHADLKTRQDKVYNELKSFDTECDSMTDDIERLQTQFSTHRQNLESIKDQTYEGIKKLEDQTIFLRKEVGLLQATNDQHDRNLKDTQKEVINAIAQLNNHDVMMCKEIEKLQDEYKLLLSSVTKLQEGYESIRTLTGAHAYLSGEIDKLKGLIKTANDSLNLLSAKQLRNAPNSLPCEVFRLKSGKHTQATKVGFKDFPGAVGIVKIPVHRVKYHLSISGHWVDTAGARVYFRFKFTPQNAPNSQPFYFPDESGTLKYMYTDHCRLEEYSTIGVITLEPGEYNVRLEINVVDNGGATVYNWDGASYGPIVMTLE